MLGANYWGKDWGTEMWLHYDGARIRDELKQLASYGVRCLRVFPNWRDFQPVEKAYAWQGTFGEYLNSHTGEPVYGDGVDMDRIEDFRDFCHAAEENGITLVVAIVTGWMSGRLFVPPVLSGKNLITDPEALTWMRRFICRFVGELKNERAIIMWDLGNECNCLGEAKTQFDAYVWTSTVVDAIRSQDTSRAIGSGMHGLGSGGNGAWQVEHQGELCDIMTTHPYPSPTVSGDMEPYNRLRMTFLPTAQSLFYGGIAKRPAYIQECGTFSQTIGNNQMSADFMRIQVLSGLVNGLCGFQWWCAWEQDHLNFPPYSWSTIERQLGLFDRNGEPKPVALEMKKMSKLIEELPDPFPARQVDGVCVLSRQPSQQSLAISAQTFGKQAGIDLDVAYSENGEIPLSDLYFMPAINGWQVIYKKTSDVLFERVRNGASLCISFNGGQLTDFSELVGAYSSGIMANSDHRVTLGGESVSYRGTELLLTPTTAEVLLENEAGNPVLLKNKYGNGWIYFINFAPEIIAFDTVDGFNKYPYYMIYQTVASDVIAKKPVCVTSKDLGLTLHPQNDGGYLVSVLNYSDHSITPEIKIANDYRIKTVLYGDLKELPSCDGVIFSIEKN